MINSKNLSAFILIVFSFFITSCAAIEGIFKAGVGVGVFMVLAVLVFIIFIFTKLRKK